MTEYINDRVREPFQERSRGTQHVGLERAGALVCRLSLVLALPDLNSKLLSNSGGFFFWKRRCESHSKCTKCRKDSDST